MRNDLAAAAPPLVLAAFLLWRGFRPLTVGDLAKWQARFDATVTSETAEFVRGRLQRGRRFRSSLIAAGVAIMGLPIYMNLIDRTRSADFANGLVGNAWLFGAAFGAVMAEVLVMQRPRGRVAALVARRGQDYVDARFVRAVFFAVPAALALGLTSTVMSSFDPRGESWVGVTATVVAAVAVRVGLRSIAGRPALDPGGPLEEVDDALRADGAHHLVGAAVALAATGVVTAAPSLGGPGALLGIVWVVGSIGTILGYASWWTLARDARWSVRRARAAA